MSTKLYWRPVPKEPILAEYALLPLKAIIARRYLDHDGSLGSSEVVLNKTDISYVRGLVDGGVEEADRLLEALVKHESLYIWTAE